MADYFKMAIDNARREFCAYQLPDGRIVDLDVTPETSAVRGASPIAFQLEDGRIVQAVKVGTSTHPEYVAYLNSPLDPRD